MSQVGNKTEACTVVHNLGFRHDSKYNCRSGQFEEFFTAVALGFTGVFKCLQKDLPPCGAEAQMSWILNCLRHSTKGLSKIGIAESAAVSVMGMVQSVQVGREAEHLRSLLDVVDFKGSDVRLETGSILEGVRQPIPYPAPVWQWQVVQSYPWKQTQHINVLELVACFNYF